MPTKNEIIDNIGNYSAQQLVNYIEQGILSRDECNVPECSKKVRREIDHLLCTVERDTFQKAKTSYDITAMKHFISTYPNSDYKSEAEQLINKWAQEQANVCEANDWDNVDKSDVKALQRFIDEYPDSTHCQDARKLINEIEKNNLSIDLQSLIIEIKEKNNDDEIINTIGDYIDDRAIKDSDLLKIIKVDNNIFSPNVVKQFIDKNYLTRKELNEIGVDKKFIACLSKNYSPQAFAGPKPLTSIEKTCTEVYFWGIPSSGKSCALGAILSAANDGEIAKTMVKDNDCQGYGYMNRLSEIFAYKDNVCILPAGTPTEYIYAMSFDLVDKEKREHPITCIDLAGELIEIMYKKDAGERLSEQQEQILAQMTDVLIDKRSKNTKAHFFVVEYGVEDRRYKGLSQKTILDAAVRYIASTGIFEKDTDAVYLLITKVDKAGVSDVELPQVLKQYVKKNYLSFYNGLKKICEDCEISGKEVEIVPFSLGKVCFQQYCLFDPAAAQYVVEKFLIERTKGFNTGKISKFTQKFKR